MPELPEVEQGAQLLRNAAIAQRITAVEVLHPAYARALPQFAAESLVGRSVVDVVRRGKHQVATLDDGRALEVHFRMTGEWVVGLVTDPTPRFARLMLDLANGTRLILSDPRALGSARLHPAGALTLPQLGPEPLTPAFTARRLKAALTRRRGPIKPVLLDQGVVAGLGNIYAGEALWLARVSPRVSAASLPAPRVAALAGAIRTVLRRAPAFRYADLGARSAVWRVYDRAGEPCHQCRSRIRRIVQAGRSTYYCPRCQAQ